MPHLRLCQITLSNSRDCQRAVPDDFPMDICEMHALMTVAVMKERGGALMKRLDAVYEEPRVVSDRAKAAKPIYTSDGRPTVVYYMRFETEIKIGITTNLRQRASSLHPLEVMAIEPGGRGEERLQHRRFWAHRTRGEYFRINHDLLDHVAFIRKLYGDPFEAFDSWDTRREAA